MRTRFWTSIVLSWLIFTPGLTIADDGAGRKPLPGAFQPDGSYKPTPAIERSYKLKLDTFTAFFPDRGGDIRVGAGLAFKIDRLPNFRPSIQAANQMLGVGLAYRVFPVIDGSVGVSVMRDFDANATRVGGFFSVATW